MWYSQRSWLWLSCSALRLAVLPLLPAGAEQIGAVTYHDTAERNQFSVVATETGILSSPPEVLFTGEISQLFVCVTPGQNSSTPERGVIAFAGTTELWRQLDEPCDPRDQSPVLSGLTLLVSCFSREGEQGLSGVLAYEVLDGAPKWNWEPALGTSSGQAVGSVILAVAQDVVVVSTAEYSEPGCGAGVLYGIDLTTGNELWSLPGVWSVTKAAYQQGIMYVADHCGALLALDTLQGQVLWGRKWFPSLPGAVVSDAVRLHANTLYLGMLGGLRALSLDGDELWSWAVSTEEVGVAVGPVAVDEYVDEGDHPVLVFATADGSLTALQPQIETRVSLSSLTGNKVSVEARMHPAKMWSAPKLLGPLESSMTSPPIASLNLVPARGLLFIGLADGRAEVRNVKNGRWLEYVWEGRGDGGAYIRVSANSLFFVQGTRIYSHEVPPKLSTWGNLEPASVMWQVNLVVCMTPMELGDFSVDSVRDAFFDTLRSIILNITSKEINIFMEYSSQVMPDALPPAAVVNVSALDEMYSNSGDSAMSIAQGNVTKVDVQLIMKAASGMSISRLVIDTFLTQLRVDVPNLLLPGLHNHNDTRVTRVFTDDARMVVLVPDARVHSTILSKTLRPWIKASGGISTKVRGQVKPVPWQAVLFFGLIVCGCPFVLMACIWGVWRHTRERVAQLPFNPPVKTVDMELAELEGELQGRLPSADHSRLPNRGSRWSLAHETLYADSSIWDSAHSRQNSVTLVRTSSLFDQLASAAMAETLVSMFAPIRHRRRTTTLATQSLGNVLRLVDNALDGSQPMVLSTQHSFQLTSSRPEAVLPHGVRVQAVMDDVPCLLHFFSNPAHNRNEAKWQDDPRMQKFFGDHVIRGVLQEADEDSAVPWRASRHRPALRAYHQQRGRDWTEREILHLLAQLSGQLDELHRLGLVHGCVVMDNIMWDDRAQKWTLADFSCIAEIATEILLSLLPISVRDAAPEHIQVAATGSKSLSVSAQTDAWQLGLIGYQLASGQHLFHPDMPLQQVISQQTGQLMLPWEFSQAHRHQQMQILGMAFGPIELLLHRDPDERVSIANVRGTLANLLANLHAEQTAEV